MDAAAPQSAIPARHSRVIKGFILGALFTALVYPRVMGPQSAVWVALGGGDGGGGGAGGGYADPFAAADAAAGVTQRLCPVQYYPNENATAAGKAPPGIPGTVSVAGRAKGCPPPPALCRMSDVFDEIVVLSLPRRAAQFKRLSSQLRALGETFTLVNGYDIRTRAVSSMWERFTRRGDGYDTVGEFAVGLGWLSILEHVVASGAQHVVVFEDDAVFHSNFPVEFDRRIRQLPPDWAIFYLGATQINLWNGEQVKWPEGVDVPELYRPLYTWGAFAVAFNAETAVSMLEMQAQLTCRIDICTLPGELRRNRDRNVNFAAYPHIVVADVRYSDLRAAGDIKEYAAGCRWNLAMFDFDNGYTGGDGSGGAGVDGAGDVDGRRRLGAPAAAGTDAAWLADLSDG
jgi:hypothetical protein